MQLFKWALPLWGMLLFSGCGEEVFTTGVGLVGTGSGSSGVPGGTPNPMPPNKGDIEEPPINVIPPPEIEKPPLILEEENYEYYYEGGSEKQCGGIERSLYLLNHKTGQILPPHIAQRLGDENLGEPNITAQMVVQNQTNDYLYEYIGSCRSPFLLTDEMGTLQKGSQQLSCEIDEAIQVYPPHTRKTYYFKFSVPQASKYWDLKYNAQYSLNNIQPEQQRMRCENLDISFQVARDK